MKKTVLIFLVLLFLFASQVCAQGGGNVAIAAEANSATAAVSGTAARCPYFLIYDGGGKLLEAVDNPYQSAKRQAGVSVAPFLVQKGVTVVVAGGFGENMIRAMKEKGIEYVQFHGSAEAALKSVLEAR